MKSIENARGKITYDKLFWLFMAGSVAGVLVEGLFCLILRGKWESHVVALVGPFNALYGTGAVLFYIVACLMREKKMYKKVLTIMALATVLELIAGILLADCLGMKAWDYSQAFLNYKGMICLSFTLGWGAAGFLFCLVFDKIDLVLCKLQGKVWHILCIALSIFMAVNLALTCICIVRWSERHYHKAPDTAIGRYIDTYTPDKWMKHRFVEWFYTDDVYNKK